MAMKYMKLYYDFGDMVDELSDEEMGRLVRAMLTYSQSGECEPLTGNERFLFPVFKAQIDRDKGSYDAVCSKRSASGKMGGHARAANASSLTTDDTIPSSDPCEGSNNLPHGLSLICTSEEYAESDLPEETADALSNDSLFAGNTPVKQIQANASKTKQNFSVQANPGKTLQEKDQEKNKYKEKEKERLTARSAPAALSPSVEDVKAYCEERGNGIDPRMFFDYYAARGWMTGSVPVRDWKALVRTWELRERATHAGAESALTAADGSAVSRAVRARAPAKAGPVLISSYSREDLDALFPEFAMG